MTLDPPILLVRDIDGVDHTRQWLARRASTGALHRVARGAYVDAAAWNAMDDRSRHLARIDAATRARGHPPVLSHWSAAALHGLPLLGPWPDRVHTLGGPQAGGRSTAGIAVHASHSFGDHVIEVDGRHVTSLERTLVDLAAVVPFETAVVLVDHALFVDRFGRQRTEVTRETLRSTLLSMLPVRGHARAGRVFSFAEAGAQTPIESVSRVTMWRIGCPKPELQHPFSDSAGFIGASDFWWRRFRIAGEADGETKYLDVATRGGRPVEQVYLEEKLREDRIRAQGDHVSRWGWRVARDGRLLRDHLLRAGVTMGARWATE